MKLTTELQDEWHSRIFVINGEAGTGKTTLIKSIAERFNIIPSATTWAAASLINGATFYRVDRLNAEFEETNPDPRPLRWHNDVRLIDESSMLSKTKLYWMLKRYPGRKFILVGDWNQLPPVNAEPIDISLFNSITLSKQFRALDPNLVSFLGAIKRGEMDEIRRVITNRTITDADRDSFPVSIDLQYKNETRIRNYHPRKIGETLIGTNVLFQVSEDEFERTEESKESEKRHSIKVFPKHSWWFHNEFVVLKDMTKSGWLVEKRNGKTAMICPEDIKFWESAHSLTVHKVQGQTIKNTPVIVNLDFSEKDIKLYQKLLYVACSRVTDLTQLHFCGQMNPSLKFFPFPQNPNTTYIDADSTEIIEKVNNFVTELTLSRPLKGKMPKTSCYNLELNSVGILGNLKETAKGDKLLINEAFRNHSSFKKTAEGKHYLNPNGQYFAKNPLFPGSKSASHANLLYPLRWFCFEFDELSLEEQLELAKQNQKHILCIVWSGSKSLHLWMHSKQVYDTIESYEKAARQINQRLFAGKACSSCVSPSQLMRRPNALRENGKMQYPLWLGNQLDFEVELTSQELFPENYRTTTTPFQEKAGIGPYIQCALDSLDPTPGSHRAQQIFGKCLMIAKRGYDWLSFLEEAHKITNCDESLEKLRTQVLKAIRKEGI
jgi:hypothetical protein